MLDIIKEILELIKTILETIAITLGILKLIQELRKK